MLTVEEIGQFGAFGETSVEAQVSVLDASWCKEQRFRARRGRQWDPRVV